MFAANYIATKLVVLLRSKYGLFVRLKGTYGLLKGNSLKGNAQKLKSLMLLGTPLCCLQAWAAFLIGYQV